jgi:hypothetical protein
MGETGDVESEVEDCTGVVPLIEAHFPGVEVAVDVHARSSTVAATAVDRVKAARQMERCYRCDDEGVAGERRRTTVGIYYPVEPEWVAVLPGDWTDRDMKLTGALGLTGVKVATVPRVGCVGRGEDEGRKPNKVELDNCYGNVHDAIWAAGCDYVVLVGRAALDLWRPDCSADQLHGKIGVLWDRYVVMGLRDVRWARDSGNAVERRMIAENTRDAARRWKEAVRGGGQGKMGNQWGSPLLPVTRHMAVECVECGSGAVDSIDRDALGWCREHRNARWMKVRGLAANHGVQEGLW